MSRLTEAAVGVGLAALGLALTLAAADSLAEPAPVAPPAAPAAPPPDAPARVASYRLEASLDVPAHRVTGKGTLTWTNASSEPTRELWFHLYLNAFKNDKTVFLRSPFGAGRSGDHGSDYGYIDVSRLTVRELGTDDLWPRAARHSPGDPDDQTDIVLPLPAEVAPGATLHIDFEWQSRLPSIVERTGYSGSFHLVGHWFPKIARREPDGRWAHFTFHPQAEFYADFGSYDVSLDVPAEMVVGATGTQVRDERQGARRRLEFHADPVHDFVWTASPEFRERGEQIDGVRVRFLYPPGHETNTETAVDAIRFALPRFNRLYGAYPHPTLTVVHPPEHARNAGGMEYPALITTGGPWWAAKSGVRMIEGVTVHELGHQWFQGILASNEQAWPFLDEGFNTFAEMRALDARYGPGSMIALPGLTLSGAAARRAVAISAGHDHPVAQPADRFSSFDSIGALVYARTAITLETVGNVWGHDGLERAFSRYARRERFRHPGPKGFLEDVRVELGNDAHGSLHTALFDKGWVDYELADLDCVEIGPARGVFGDGAARTTSTGDGEKQRSCRALVRRKGTLRFPVDVELIFADGTRQRRRWQADEDWATFDATGKSEVVAATVDPDRLVLLDENLGNNSRRQRSEFGHRALERLTYAAGLALALAGP
ncbi:MAG: M1 family metallopeptidase [Myxococcales bacterium]|nr:M1 family metallopeptidase [Myxococcales bacterium]